MSRKVYKKQYLKLIWGDILVFVELYQRFVDIVFAPFYYKDMVWILIPLLVSLLLMEFYFDRYKAEELGWNTAFGNSLVLIFVSLDLLRFLYIHGMLDYVTLENALVIAVVFLGLTLTVMTFFHVLPKELAYGFSSRLPINIVAYLAIVIVYAGIVIDFYTAVASVFFAVLVSLVLKLVSWLVPESGEIPELEKIEEE